MKKDETEILVYTVRPDGTPLWLPKSVAAEIGAKHGTKLTRDQYDGDAVQDLLMQRQEKEIKKKKGSGNE